MNNPPTLVVCVLELVNLRGEVYLPPTPLRPGPLAARPWPQFVYSEAIRKLGPNFGPWGPNPATRGVTAHFSINLNLSHLVPNFVAKRDLGTNSFKLT